jgi:hypothetical protein
MHVVYVRSGLVYLCGHHFKKHAQHIKSKGYRHASTVVDKADGHQRLGHL